MIDDDSNELIPSDGGGDNDENAEDGNADDVQSVSIIQDETNIRSASAVERPSFFVVSRNSSA